MIILETPGSFASLQELEPQRVDYGAPEAGGRLGGVQAGFPLWLGVWTIGKVASRRSDALRAWVARMRGQQRRFLGRDAARPYPLAHINGFTAMTTITGDPFLGACSDWSESIDGDGNSILTLVGVPSGLILSVGDYCDFRWEAASEELDGAEWRDMIRVVGASDGSIGDAGFAAMADEDGEISVMVEPPLSSVVPVDAVAHLDRPACIMTLVSDRSKLDAVDRRLAVRGGAIVGLQDLRL